MKLSDINYQWSIDSKIDPQNIELESLKICDLHHKWLTIFTEENLRYQQMDLQYKTLYRERWKFYNKMGDLNEYKSYDRDSYFDKKLLKPEQQIFIDSDETLLAAKEKIFVQKQKVEVLESILKMISTRTYQIKNYIEYVKFKSGF
jgi:hypothetical protein